MVNNKSIEKVCIICNEKFTPDPRVGDRQKVCNKTYCKLQRKKRAQQHWVRKNPSYFKGRYPQLKEQILANNKKKAQSRPTACFSIQDKLTSNQNKLLTALEYLMSIQDEITRIITKGKSCLQDTLTLVYKTS
jgi:hypothetical protein